MSGVNLEYRLPDGEPVSRDECDYCFSNQYAPDGQFLCLFCDTCCCAAHTLTHQHRTGHSEFVCIKYTFNREIQDQYHLFSLLETTPIDTLATAENKVFRIQNKQLIEVTRPSDEQEVSAALISDCPIDRRNVFLDPMEASVSYGNSGCLHIKELQVPSTTFEPVIKCAGCNLQENLWLCLTCGQLSCGRRHPDGQGGNGHALQHNMQTGHPLALKLTSCSKNIQEVYCYACDNDAVIPVPVLQRILSAWNLEFLLSRATGTEESLENQLKNSMMITQASKRLLNPEIGLHVYDMIKQKPLRNVGNTCYCNCVVNCLLSNRMKFNALEEHISKCKCRVQLCFQCQFVRIYLSSARYGKAHCARLLRTLNDYFTNEQNIGKQQDAVDVYDKISRGLQLPRIKCRDTYHCSACGHAFEAASDVEQTYLSVGMSFYKNRQSVDLAAAIQQEFGNEGQKCPNCSRADVQIDKKVKYLTPLPPMVCVQINRLQFDREQMRVVKMGIDIDNCQDILVGGQHSYKLNSFVVHTGQSYDCGHYIAYCYSKELGGWLECNDDRFCNVSDEQLREKSKQAYLLFYEKSE